MIVTSILVHTPPPHGIGHDHPHDAAAINSPKGGAQPFTVATTSGARSLILTVADRRVGTTVMTLEFSGADGAPFVPRAVSVELALPAAGIAPILRNATAIAPGRHQVEAAIFPLPGRWQLRIDALVSDFEKAVFETTIEIR